MIDPRTIFAAFLGLLVAGGIIYSVGFDGRIGSVRIGPDVPWLKLAGR